MPIWASGSESFISRIIVFWAGWSFLSRRLRKPFITHSFFGQFRIIKLQLWYNSYLSYEIQKTRLFWASFRALTFFWVESRKKNLDRDSDLKRVYAFNLSRDLDFFRDEIQKKVYPCRWWRKRREFLNRVRYRYLYHSCSFTKRNNLKYLYCYLLDFFRVEIQ